MTLTTGVFLKSVCARVCHVSALKQRYSVRHVRKPYCRSDKLLLLHRTIFMYTGLCYSTMLILQFINLNLKSFYLHRSRSFISSHQRSPLSFNYLHLTSFHPTILHRISLLLISCCFLSLYLDSCDLISRHLISSHIPSSHITSPPLTPSHFTSTHITLFCLVSPHPILSHLWSHLKQSNFASPNLVSPHLISSRLTLPYFDSHHLIVSHLNSSHLF